MLNSILSIIWLTSYSMIFKSVNFVESNIVHGLAKQKL